MANAVPEKIAKFIAHYIFKTFKPQVVIDGLCGVGTTSIQFAKFGKVISIDID
jgi:tRNA/tmRNA/rRNA uracil-C5-methylase (TrmA/RlmC/RlmD family)